MKKIYGINSFLANQICDQLGFHMNLTVGELSVDQTEKMGRILQYYYLTENELIGTHFVPSELSSNPRSLACSKTLSRELTYIHTHLEIAIPILND